MSVLRRVMNVTPRQHAPTPSGVTHAPVTQATEGPVEHVLVSVDK